MGKRYKCPYCDFRGEKEKLIDHIEHEHEDMIPEQFTAARLVFNNINKKLNGNCVVCGKETRWNEKSYRYNRLCDNPKCREALRAQYEKNMIKVYNKITLLDDPAQQEKMLANRKISGTYKFKDGGVRIFTGSYEKKTLEFMDKVLDIDSSDIMSPGPKFEYMYEGKKHIWITDILYLPYNLVIEVKDGGDNPNNRQMVSYRDKQVCKEVMLTKLGTYNYLRLTNNEFQQLMLMLAELKLKMIDNDTSATIKINETCAAVMGAIPSPYKGANYVVAYGNKNTFTNNEIEDFAVTNSISSNTYIARDKTGKLVNTDGEHFKDRKMNIYKTFMSIKEIFEYINNMTTKDQLEYDFKFENVNFKKIKDRTNVAILTILQEAYKRSNKALPYLPVMNPLDICKKQDILKYTKNIGIMEDMNGYFAYNINSGARSISHKKISDIIMEDSSLEDNASDEWELNSNRSFVSNTDSEEELNADWNRYNSMPRKQRRESDWKSLELYGKTNKERYEEMKSKFLKADLDTVDNRLSYDGETVSLNVESVDPQYNYGNVNYTHLEVETAITWGINAIRAIIVPTDNLEDLELLWVKYNSMIRKHKRESDWKSMELFDMNNETHYNYLKSKFLKADIPEVPIDISDNGDVASVTQEICIDVKESTNILEMAQYYTELKNINPSNLSEKTLVSNILEFTTNRFDALPDNLDTYNELPYYTPEELLRMGIFNGADNRYSATPDNLALDNGSPKKWFEAYEHFYNTSIMGMPKYYKDLNMARVNKLNELYLDYACIIESHDDKAIADRKQSILELGWNPELEFNSENRIYANKRINGLFVIPQVSIFDVSESVSKLEESTELDTVQPLTDVLYKPIYIVFLKSDTVFGSMIKLFKKGDISHVAIGFDYNLKHLYSFNAFKNGFAEESISSYTNITNMKVFTVFISGARYNTLKNNIKEFINKKNSTVYNYAGIIKLAFNIKDINKSITSSMFCSQFVDSMLKLADIHITKKISSVVTPSGLFKAVSKKKEYIYKIFDGDIKLYSASKVKKFIESYLNKMAVHSEFFSNVLGYSSILKEAKSFPVQFDDDGNLLIENPLSIDLDKEYAKSHKLLIVYEKSKNYDGLKYELSKLWYLNSIIEHKMYDKGNRSSTLIRTRARVLNDFNKYMHIVVSRDKTFNFTEYYNNTPFDDATIKINGSTLKYTAEYIKALLHL